MNFGPLNKEGGWKRLNVAVSRARCEMVVFTTLTSDMIDLKRTKSKGVEALKNFLEFAEKGRMQIKNTGSQTRKKQGIRERICQKLNEAGYQCQTDVGRSDFKVDIAVVNPYNNEEYLIGIMLDGDSYRQSANTKDREVAQINVLKGLGWELYRIWTMDWWENREKEISRLLNFLEKRKQEESEAAIKKRAVQAEMLNALEGGNDANVADAKAESTEEVLQGETVKQEDKEHAGSVLSEVNTVPGDNVKESEIEPPVFSAEVKFVQNDLMADEPSQMIAVKAEEKTESFDSIHSERYECIEYESANVAITPITTAAYAAKDSMKLIEEKMNDILDKEAPISYERLLKKTLRGFEIGRASAQTIEATDKVIKKMSLKANRQNGMKFYWKEGQNPESYNLYRIDVNADDKRTPADICQQELKNAVCKTLQEKGALAKDDLIRDTIRTMGYARSGAALIEAVDRGLKFGRKTGEIVQTEEKKFVLSEE